ncbi:MAG: c-type cytochrome [Pseudomonadota bacterium]
MNDPLFGNKLAAAILTALLLFFGLPQLANALLGGGHHGGGHEGENPFAGYPVEIELAAGGGEKKKELDLGTLLASASPQAGERRAALCVSCHSLNKNGGNGTGPALWDVVGRDVAGVAGFGYSGALKGAGGEWSYERLDQYLRNSQDYIPGTAMVQRFPKAEQRADILAFLGTLSEDPVPFPAPAPVEAEAESEEAPAE